MSRDILNLATFGVAGALFGHKKKTPEATPAQTGPVVMPLPDESRILQARKRAIASRLQTHGRDSTMLSGSGAKLGG